MAVERGGTVWVSRPLLGNCFQTFQWMPVPAALDHVLCSELLAAHGHADFSITPSHSAACVGICARA